MMDIPADIIELLECATCDGLLKVGPVYQRHKGGAVCGYCQEDLAQPASRCLVYEATAQLLRFPCHNRREGCPAFVPFRAADSTEFSHEDVCEYREYWSPERGSQVEVGTDESMTDGDGDAMDKAQNGDIMIGPQPQDIASTIQDVEMAGDEARSEATFMFRVSNFSKLKIEDPVFSPPCYVRNLPWKIIIMHRTSQTEERQTQRSLGFFLQCNWESKSTSWSCHAVAEMRLYSHNPDVVSYCRKIQHLFCSKENYSGFKQFIEWNDLLEPENGYVKDDSITLEVHVVADAPHGVSLDSKKHTGLKKSGVDQETQTEAENADLLTENEYQAHLNARVTKLEHALKKLKSMELQKLEKILEEE